MNKGATTYKLNTDKYCPTCGGKAQDPQMSDPETSVSFSHWEEDGTEVWHNPPEPCDEPYHDPADPDYEED